MPSIDFSRLHEREDVLILLPAPLRPSEVEQMLRRIGGVPHDDFVEFPRTDEIQVWQTATITTVSLYSSDRELNHYFDDPDHEDLPECDRLQLKFLMATVPSEIVASFLDLVEEVQQSSGGRIEHEGRQISSDELRCLFESYMEDLAEELAEVPGSEFLAITIAESYPR